MNREGLVIVGYQGIGKSTLSDNYSFVIDLESSNFFVDGKRSNDWYIPYCNIARDLCRQGFYVCVSSHKEVREELQRKPARHQVIVCPALYLRDKWIKNLKYRYENCSSEKNYKAYISAKANYGDNINDLMNQDGFKHLVIDDMSYSLAELLNIN